MSKLIPELIAPATQQGTAPPKRAPAWQTWLKWALVVVACLWLADTGISLLIRHTSLRNRLTARLEAAFGRPVEVGNYHFSLWTGPELQAYPVQVAEDPRFGYEYFLRADSMTLRVRLSSLLLGRLELGTIALSHPSLNLVRDATGDWNLAEWLPRPEDDGGSAGKSDTRIPRKSPVPRFHDIEVNGGRIDFKRGDEKLPFAFVDVNGAVEMEGPGRWRLDLVAAPERAAVIVQDPGVLHLVGHLGGTSSRLRPALLQIGWSDASIPDVLRLVDGSDYGLRGTMSVSATAETHGDAWTLNGHALLSQLHRWDLPLRADNPSVTITAGGQLDPTGSRFEVINGKIAMAHSSAEVKGALDWTHPGPAFADLFVPQRPAPRVQLRHQAKPNAANAGTKLQVASRNISMADLLDWTRAFHPGIANEVAMGGVATLHANLGGWPPRLLDAGFTLDRGSIIGAGMPSVRLASVELRYDSRKGITLAPATVTIGRPANSFRVEGSANLPGAFSLHVRGGATNVRGVIESADNLGWNIARGWAIAGPAQCDLRWDSRGLAGQTALSGSVQWGTPAEGVSLGAPFLNRRVEQIHARADLQPNTTRIALTSARAFGTRWSGTLEHQLSDGWKFAVAGKSLSAAELDRWLDPRWRESFLDRLLPFLNSTEPASSALDALHASGKIALDEFALAPVAVHRFQGNLTIDGRRVELTGASGQFDRGQVAGSLKANFAPAPRYEVTADFSGVDLQALSADFPSLAGGFSGTAAAKVRFVMRGASRSDLAGSLECAGTAVAKGLSVANIALPVSTSGAASSQVDDPGPTLFPEASAAFSCTSGKIELRDLALSGADGNWNGTGSVDFARNLDLRLRPVGDSAPEANSVKVAAENDADPSADSPDAEYRITGTLANPRVLRSRIVSRARAGNP